MPASAEAWRCFLAVPVTPDVRDVLVRTVDAWRANPAAPNLRWTDPEGWHLTLAFLGATDPARVPALVHALDGMSDLAPFGVQMSGVGAFPHPAAAQTVWVGMADADDARAGHLADFAGAVQDAVLPPESRPTRFHPHLTVGRSRERRGEPLGAWLASANVPPVSMEVTEVVLYRSHVGRGPARYEALARVRLRSAGSGRG